MRMVFVIYIVISLIFGFIGLANVNTNKINYSMILALLMLIISPIIARCCGIC